MNEEQVHAVQSLVTQDSRLAELCRRAAEVNLQIYLCGGALRDLLLDGAQPKELDLLIQSPRDSTQSLTEGLSNGSASEKICFKLDLAVVQDAASHLSHFDFTVNALAIELNTGAVLDPTGSAAADIKNRLLRPISYPLFLSSPKALLRLHRFSAEKSLSIDSEAAKMISTHRRLMAAADSVEYAVCFGEFLSILSLKGAAPALSTMASLGTLEGVLPEAAYCSLDRDAAQFEQASKRLDEIAAALPSDLASSLTKTYNQQLTFQTESGDRSSTFFWSVSGLLRLLTILMQSFHSLKALPSLIPPFRDQNGEEHALRNLILNTSRRLSAAPVLQATVSKLIPPAILVLREAPLDSSLPAEERDRLLAHLCLAALNESGSSQIEAPVLEAPAQSFQDLILSSADKPPGKS